jgi:protein AroM
MTINSTEKANLLRVAFVSVGQTPRMDVVPEILAQLDLPIAATEFGALEWPLGP